MALLQNKPCHFYGRQKICVQTKFELSRWTLALSGSNFSFRSLNKLGPLVTDIKITISGCAHTAQDKFSQVWSTSVNFKDNFLQALCRTVDNPICSIYDVRSNNAKKKKWMPYGHQKRTSSICLLGEKKKFWQESSEYHRVTAQIGDLHPGKWP